MEKVEDFSHGSYVDYSGVVFYGPPTKGFWLDRMAVSEFYIHPLFSAITDRNWDECGGKGMPNLIRDWNSQAGWVATERAIEIPHPDAISLLDALASLTLDDVLTYCTDCEPEECLRCASGISQFLSERLAQGFSVFIESE